MVSDDSGDDSDAVDARGGGTSRTKSRARAKIAAKQAELDSLLSAGVSGNGGGLFAGKYPLKTGKLEMPKHMIREYFHSYQLSALITGRLS